MPVSKWCESQYPGHMVKLDWNRYLAGAEVRPLPLPGAWVVFEVIRKSNFQDGIYLDDRLVKDMSLQTRFNHPHSGRGEGDDLMEDILPTQLLDFASPGKAITFGKGSQVFIEMFVEVVGFLKCFGSHMFDQIVSLGNLFSAWREFRRGKRRRQDVQEFERSLEDNIFELHDELVDETYRHGSYHRFHIFDPKHRIIHKATVRDRLVHHALYRVLYPLFDRSFIFDSYSCRVGKGTHAAVGRLERFTRQVSRNYQGSCWALKFDVKKFFDSVDHGILMEILSSSLRALPKPRAKRGGKQSSCEEIASSVDNASRQAPALVAGE